jgi:hypothetical protein
MPVAPHGRSREAERSKALCLVAQLPGVCKPVLTRRRDGWWPCVGRHMRKGFCPARPRNRRRRVLRRPNHGQGPAGAPYARILCAHAELAARGSGASKFALRGAQRPGAPVFALVRPPPGSHVPGGHAVRGASSLARGLGGGGPTCARAAFEPQAFGSPQGRRGLPLFAWGCRPRATGEGRGCAVARRRAGPGAAPGGLCGSGKPA